jgi:hypothetical protein
MNKKQDEKKRLKEEEKEIKAGIKAVDDLIRRAKLRGAYIEPTTRQ